MGRGEHREAKPKQHTHTSPAHPSASASDSDSAWANFPGRSRRSRAGAIRQRAGVQEFDASRGLPRSRSAQRWDWLEGPPKSRLCKLCSTLLEGHSWIFSTDCERTLPRCVFVQSSLWEREKFGGELSE
ncbi:hypothetical protein SRHO_G00110960 [Serrasalmus rhombeus]